MMYNPVKLFTRACVCAGILLSVTSCKDTDEFFTDKGGEATDQAASTFDFSTVRKVDLQVDYSAYQTHGPVRFSIYSRNPYSVETDETKLIDETIEPLFTGYTDERGKFDNTVSLPAYAKVLYIVTGDMFVGAKKMVVEVSNGSAKAVASSTGGISRAELRRVKGTGTQTNDLTNLYNLWMKTDNNGVSTGEQVYKRWVTPLGTWDSNSGRPSYLLEHTEENKAKGLVFRDEELDGMYKTIKSALSSAATCSETYRTQSDLTLIKDSEVSITMMGGNTCWCSTLGYYYYTDATKPQNLMDLNIIMLFPNTMDELYEDRSTCDLNGNVGVNTGDVVQLMYYPNIASGDLTGGTKIFPRGTKIGFIMKTNGWGSQPGTYNSSQYGTEYSILKGKASIGWNLSRKYNNWPSSTDGFSYCTALKDTGNKLIQNGNARTAKFSYVSASGKDFPIVSFEDACNDENYSDVIFSLNPAESFATLAEVGANKSTTVGVYAFEDMWPAKGDYDMNDVVVNVKNELITNGSGKVTKQTFYLTTYQKTVNLINGLAARLNTKTAPSSVTMKRMAKGVTDPTKATAVTYASYTDTNTGKKVYYLTEKVEVELGSTYILELAYSGIDAKNIAAIEPFVYRAAEDGKQLEIHIPLEKPTSKMDTSLFGKDNDRSNPSKGEYFVRAGLYPFAFYLSGTKAESFFETILAGNDESPTIDTFYPGFLGWSTSKGTQDVDWYLNPNKK